MSEKIEVYLKQGRVTVRKTKKFSFPFIVEMDGRGYSRIDYENGEYRLKNFLDGKCIDNKVIEKAEVRKIISEVIRNVNDK